jgi:hypothetical protein
LPIPSAQYFGPTALNSIVSPREIFTRKPQHKIHNLFLHTWPAYGLATVTIIPFLSHQRSMPTQDRIGCDNGGQFHQGFSAQGLAFDRQEPALIIGQQKPFLPLCFHQGFKFRLIELINLFLLAMNPTRENHEEELPGLQDEAHGMLGGEAEKLHHVAWADECQGPKSAEKSLLGVSQLAWREAVMVRRSFLTGRYFFGPVARALRRHADVRR